MKSEYSLVNLKTLDALRGLTAMYVLIHHSRQLLTQPFKNGLSIHPEFYSLYDKFCVYFFSAFKFGHEAVIIFFVLSGFVIHLKQADVNFKFNQFNILKFLKKRILRIYPTLITSFILVIFLDILIFKITEKSFKEVFKDYTLNNFIYNFLLIPNTSDWGSNFPLWSLKHEWFFYLIYPFLLYFNAIHRYFSAVFVAFLYFLYCFGIKIPFIENAAYTLTVWYLGIILAIFYTQYPIFF